jgi:hypothetical protein
LRCALEHIEIDFEFFQQQQVHGGLDHGSGLKEASRDCRTSAPQINPPQAFFAR